MAFKKDTLGEFNEKYKSHGHVGNFLIKNFFKTIKSLIPNKIHNVIEVGCGAGFSTTELSTFFNKKVSFYASDLLPELVASAQEKNRNVKFLVESIYDLSHPSNSFDLVFCLEVMEHLEDPQKALAELARISKKYAIISVPNEPLWRILNMSRGKYWSDLGNTPGHINHWSRRDFKKFVSKEFNIIKIKSSLPWTILLAEKKI